MPFPHPFLYLFFYCLYFHIGLKKKGIGPYWSHLSRLPHTQEDFSQNCINQSDQNSNLKPLLTNLSRSLDTTTLFQTFEALFTLLDVFSILVILWTQGSSTTAVISSHAPSNKELHFNIFSQKNFSNNNRRKRNTIYDASNLVIHCNFSNAIVKV